MFDRFLKRKKKDYDEDGNPLSIKARVEELEIGMVRLRNQFKTQIARDLKEEQEIQQEEMAEQVNSIVGMLPALAKQTQVQTPPQTVSQQSSNNNSEQKASLQPQNMPQMGVNPLVALAANVLGGIVQNNPEASARFIKALIKK